MTKQEVTREVVLKAKSYLDNPKYSTLTQDELALLTGISATTLSRIKNGKYDSLLEPEKVEDPQADSVVVSIDYETLKRLTACEYVVDAILRMATLHEVIDDVLFINNKALYGILRAYVPDDVEKRLNELREVAQDE